MGLLLAFKDWEARLGIFGSPWTSEYGFGNFIELFRTPDFSQAIWNTLYFNAVTILIDFPLPIILARISNNVFFGRNSKLLQAEGTDHLTFSDNVYSYTETSTQEEMFLLNRCGNSVSLEPPR